MTERRADLAHVAVELTRRETLSREELDRLVSEARLTSAASQANRVGRPMMLSQPNVVVAGTEIVHDHTLSCDEAILRGRT